MISVKVLSIVIIGLVYLTVSNAFEFKCEYSMKKGFYYCEAQELYIDEPHTMITSVTGTHLSNLTNTDVKHLGINKQNATFLPINIAEFFPNLRKFQVKNSKLEYVTENDFLGLTQLTNIYLGQNSLKEVPCGIFDTNKKIQQIHFEDNCLVKIGADIFKPLPHLKLVHLKNNTCIDDQAEHKEDVPDLLVEVAKNCSISCDASKDYAPLASSCNSTFFKKIVNEFENTVFKLNEEIYEIRNSAKTEKNKVQKEINELSKNLTELKMSKSILDHKNTINETLEKDVQNLTKINQDEESVDSRSDFENIGQTKKYLKIENDQLKDMKRILNQNEEKLNSTIAGMKNEMIAAKKESEDLQNIVSNITEINTNLKKDLSTQIEEFDKLQDEQDKLNIKLGGLEINLNQTIEEVKQNEEVFVKIIFDKDNKITENNANIEALEIKVQSLGKDLNASKLENIDINKKRAEIIQNFKELETKFNQTLMEAEQNEKNFNSTIASMKNEIIATKEEVEDLGNTVTNITSINTKLKTDFNAKIEEYQILEKDKDKLKIKLLELDSNLNHTVEDAKNNTENFNKIIFDKKISITENKKEIKALEIKVHSLGKDLDASMLENIEINEEKIILSQNLKELESTHSNMVNETKQNEEKFNHTISIMKREIIAAKEEVKDLDKTVSNINEINTNLEEEKKNLNIKVRDLETNLNQTIEDAKLNKGNFNSTIAAMRSDITAAKEEVKDLEKIVSNITAMNTNLEEEKKNLNIKVRDLETNINQTIEDAKHDTENFNKIIFDKEISIIENKEEIKDLEKTVSNITAINFNLEIDLKHETEEHHKLEQEKDNLVIKLVDLEIKFNKTIEYARINEENFMNTITTLKSDISEAQKAIEDLENTVTEIKINFEEEKKKLNMKVVSLETNLNNKIKEAKENERKLKTTIATMNNDINAAKKVIETTKASLNASKNENIRIKNEKDVLSQSNKNLTNTLSKVQKDFKKSNEMINNVKKEKVNLQKNLKISNENVGKLNKNIKELKKTTKQNEEKLNNTIIAANEEINTLENTVTNITESNSKLKKELNSQIEAFYVLEVEKDRIRTDLEVNIQSLGIAEKEWTIRCSNGDQNNCHTKSNIIGMKTSEYNNLSTFIEYRPEIDFRFENIILTQLPNGFFKHFPNLTHFFVTDTGLQSIIKGNFDDASSLLQIKINRNNIIKLNDSAFQGATELELLDLAENHIQSVSYKAFFGLTKLKKLNLSYNKIKLLNQEVFKYVPLLEHLYAENNKITVLHEKLFQKNRNLIEGNFSQNDINLIALNTFAGLTKFKYLNLQNNICINKKFEDLKDTKTMINKLNEVCMGKTKSRN